MSGSERSVGGTGRKRGEQPEPGTGPRARRGPGMPKPATSLDTGSCRSAGLLGFEESSVSEGKYRALFENVLDGVFQSTPGGRLLTANPALVRMLGYESEDELLAIDIAGELYDDPLERGVLTGRLTRDGEIRDQELVLRRRDGERVVMIENSRAVRDGRGEVLYYEGTLTDITGRREAEELFRTLAESAPVGVFIAQDDQFVFVNRHFARRMGRTEAELLGTDPHALIPEEERETVNVMTGLMVSGVLTQAFEHRARMKDGSARWLLATVAQIDYRGRPALLWNSIDITERKQSQDLFQTMASSAPVAIYIAAGGEFKFVNAQLAQIMGRQEEDLLGANPLDFVPAEEHERVLELARKMLRGEGTKAFEHRVTTKTGETRWVLGTVSTINYKGKRAILGNAIDVTDRRQALDLFETLADSSPVGIFIVQDGLLQFVNPEFQRLTGIGADDLVGKDPFLTLAPDEQEEMALNVDALLSGERRHPYEHRFTTLTGETRWLMETFTPIEYRGRPAILGNTIDITERKMFEERLAHQAFYDSLTDLPNRTLFMARLEHALAAADRRRDSVAVMFLDLDGFKLTNDNLGHAAGDQLLALIAKRLQSCVRPGDTVARIGGDEFTILLDTLARREDALRVSERIVREMQRPFDVGGEQLVVTASIGLAFSEPGRSGAGDLLREADVALYHAKADGKARCSIFSDPGRAAA